MGYWSYAAMMVGIAGCFLAGAVYFKESLLLLGIVVVLAVVPNPWQSEEQ